MPTTAQQTIDSTMDWLAQKVGFVDHMCCSSYTDQIYSEEAESFIDCNLNPVNLPASWDMDNSSIGVEEQHEELYLSPKRDPPNENIKSEGEPHTTFSLQKAPIRWEPGRRKFEIDSPDRSISTATTVTTSTTTTIVRSSRPNFSDISLNDSEPWRHRTNHSSPRRLLKDSLESSKRRGALTSKRATTPHEIFCDTNFKRKLKESKKSSRTLFNSVTEGYACDR